MIKKILNLIKSFFSTPEPTEVEIHRFETMVVTKIFYDKKAQELKKKVDK